MNRPRVIEMGVVVVLAGALVTGGALAQSPTPPGGSAQPSPMGPGMMPHHPMSPCQMPHGAMPHGPMAPPAVVSEPTFPGQDAFGAMSEIVRTLDADPHTDWSQVDLERLRQHLIDMNEIVLRAEVKTSPVPGGLVMDVTGAGRTEPAIRAMVVPLCGCGSGTVAVTVAAEASGPVIQALAKGEASRRTLLPIAVPRTEPRAVSCCGAGDAVVSDEGVRDLVKEKYGQVAVRVATGGTSCCGSTTAQGARRPGDVEPLREC